MTWLAENKRFWFPPLIVFWGCLAVLAYKVANTGGSPFEYALR